jgi:outer membrane immunogenic protein
MRKLILVGIAFFAIAMSAPASAADLPVKVPPPAPAAPAWDWSGFYLGVNVGYGVARDPISNTDGGTPIDAALNVVPAGALGGAQVGYNAQVGKWVLGAEADWQWAHQTDTTCGGDCTLFFGGISAHRYNPSIDSVGTLRGRIGYTVDRTLWYATAGGAFGRVNDNFSFTDGGTTNLAGFPGTHNQFGWVAGGGAETALAGGWSAKFEYLFVNLGSITDSFGLGGFLDVANSNIHDQIIRLGLNYRFGTAGGFEPAIGGEPGVAPLVYKAASALYKAPAAPVRTVYDWTGFYFGANIGYGVGRDQTDTFQDQALIPAGRALNEAFKLSPAGLLAGPQIGANWQTGKLVLGVEADWQRTSQEDYACRNDCNGVLNITYDQALRWFGTARARLGFAQDRTLWYVTGGGAWGRVDDNFSLYSTFFGVSPSVSATHQLNGWTAGGGVETALAGPWTAKLEYLYVDLGSVTDSYTTPALFGGTTFSNTSWIRNNIIRGGLNYRFGDPKAWDTADSSLAAPVFHKAPPSPQCIWCGWFVGLNAGGADARNRFSTTAIPTADAAIGAPPGVSEGLAALASGSAPLGSASGFTGGAQAGYNWQLGNFVPGIEADIEGFSHPGSSSTTTTTAVVVGVPITSTQSALMSTSYLGTVRGRLGFLVTPTWMAYGTGGFAYAGVKAGESLLQTGTNGFVGGDTTSLIELRPGWVVGAGTEWMFAPGWSAKAEYLHYDLGTAGFSDVAFGVGFIPVAYQTDVMSARFSGDIVRAGINYHLPAWGPGSGFSH